jgi:hypothetical protein
MQIMAEEASFQKEDNRVESQAKLWLLKGIIFCRIKPGEIFGRFDDLKATAIGTFEVLKLIFKVQKPLFCQVSVVVVNISTYFTGYGGDHCCGF